MEFNATFLVTAISFIIFAILMNLVLYKPLEQIVLKRQKFINDNYDDSQKNINKSKALIKDREDKLTNAKSEAVDSINRKTDLANAQKDEITTGAKQEALNQLKSNREYFSNAKQDAKEILKQDVLNLAQNISNKFLNADEQIKCESDDLINELMKV